LELDKKIKINIEIAYRFVLQNKATKCPWGATLAERKSRFYRHPQASLLACL
jgi:hypothetical protein